jgi:long-chain acyl-CoA synthetase
MAIRTINELFLTAAALDKSACLLSKTGGSYQPISTAELVTDVRRLANALVELGLEPGARIALMAENGPHWPTVDFATLALGGVLVPVYPTLTGEQAAYVIADCGATVAFVQGRERLEALRAEREALPGVRTWVLIDGQAGDGGEHTTLRELLRSTHPMAAPDFERRARAVEPDDLATFIYTSGTTGKPKGVMLTHGNLASNVEASLQRLDIRGGRTALSFLPLSHSFERIVDYLYFYRGLTIAYAESVQTVATNIAEVRPHMFVSVPRIYEKILAKLRETIASAPALRRRIFHWAEAVGRESLEYRLRRQKPPGLLGLRLALADRMVFRKVRAVLGGRFDYAVSGGAPLPRDVAEFFWAAGVEIYEGYGLSETSPVLSVNPRTAVRLGTVGPPIPGVEIRIAADGEILARGPNIMRGYHNLPEETAEAIDEQGWFHTGDIGQLDEAGYLMITDRKKEIIVNAYGKNVAPAPIESSLKSSRFIEQAVVIGDRRKFLSALLVPDFENLAAEAKTMGIDTGDREALLREPRIRQLYEQEVAHVNERLARYEQIREFGLLPVEFTIEGGALTPTMKVKRRVVTERYADLIDELYVGEPADG